MPWIPIAMAAGSALMGAQKAKQEQAAQKANMMANAEQMRYSPWSGMSASFMPGQALESQLGAAVGGGIQGAVLGSKLGGQFSQASPEMPKEPMIQEKPAMMSPQTSASELDLQNQLLQRGMFTGKKVKAPDYGFGGGGIYG